MTHEEKLKLVTETLINPRKVMMKLLIEQLRDSSTLLKRLKKGRKCASR